jgi:signal transduction histidine kinase
MKQELAPGYWQSRSYSRKPRLLHTAPEYFQIFNWSFIVGDLLFIKQAQSAKTPNKSRMYKHSFMLFVVVVVVVVVVVAVVVTVVVVVVLRYMNNGMCVLT